MFALFGHFFSLEHVLLVLKHEIRSLVIVGESFSEIAGQILLRLADQLDTLSAI